MDDITIDGKTWRPVAYRVPKPGEYFLDSYNVVRRGVVTMDALYFLIVELVKPMSPLADWVTLKQDGVVQARADAFGIHIKDKKGNVVIMAPVSLERLYELWQQHKEVIHGRYGQYSSHGWTDYSVLWLARACLFSSGTSHWPRCTCLPCY